MPGVPAHVDQSRGEVGKKLCFWWQAQICWDEAFEAIRVRILVSSFFPYCMICTCKRFLVGLRLHIANRHTFTPLLCCQGTIHLLLERRWPGSIHSCAAPGSFGKPVVTSTIKPMARLCLKFLSGVTFGKMPKWLAVYLG